MSNKKDITEVKITAPLIDDIELQKIDNFYNQLADEYVKCYVKEKEQVIAQRIMMNLQQENQKYKEVIDKAIELLGNYKHYSTPDEQQNSDNEDLVNKAFNILKEVK